MTLLIGLAVLIAYHAIFVAIGFALGRRAERRASAEHATLARGLHGSSDIQAALLREIDTPAFVAIVGPDERNRLRALYLGSAPAAPEATVRAPTVTRPAPPAEPAPAHLPPTSRQSGPLIGPPIPAAPPKRFAPTLLDLAPRRRRERVQLDPALVLLYLGAFLIVAAGLIYASFNWDELEGGQKLALLAAATLGFIGVGLALLGNARLRPAAETFTGVGALLIPSNIIAAMTILSGTPLRATLALQIGAALATLLYTVFAYRPGATIYCYAAVVSAVTTIGVLPASLGAHRGWALPMLALAPAAVIAIITRLGDRAGRFRGPALTAAPAVPAVALLATPVVGLPATREPIVIAGILAGAAVTLATVSVLRNQPLPGMAAIGALLAAVVVANTWIDPVAVRMALTLATGVGLLWLSRRGPLPFGDRIADLTGLAAAAGFGMTALATSPDAEWFESVGWAAALAPGLIAAGWVLIGVVRRWHVLMTPAIVLACVSYGLVLVRLGALDPDLPERVILLRLLPGMVVAALVAARVHGWPPVAPERRRHAVFLWLGFGALTLPLGLYAISAGTVDGLGTRLVAIAWFALFAAAAVLASQQQHRVHTMAIAGLWVVAGVITALEPTREHLSTEMQYPLYAAVLAALALATPLFEGRRWWRRRRVLRWPTLVFAGAAALAAAPMTEVVSRFLSEGDGLDSVPNWAAYAAILAAAAGVFGLYARYRYPTPMTLVAGASAAVAGALLLRAGYLRFDPGPLPWTAIGIALGLALLLAADRLDGLRGEIARRWAQIAAGSAGVALLVAAGRGLVETARYVASAWSATSALHADAPARWLPLLGGWLGIALTAHWLARRLGIRAGAAIVAAAGLIALALATRMLTTDPFAWTVVGIAVGLAALVGWSLLRTGNLSNPYRAGWIPVALALQALGAAALAANVAAGIAGEIEPWRNVALYSVLAAGAAMASVRLGLPRGLYASTVALGLAVLFTLLTPQVDALDGLLIPAAIAWALVLGSLAPRLTRPWSQPLERSGYAFGAVPALYPFVRTSQAWDIDSGIYARVTLAIVSLGLVVGLAAVVRRSPVRASVAIPLVMAGAARQVATYEPESWRAYAVVLAIALAATGLAWHRTRRVSDPLYGLAGAVLIGVPFVESFTIGGTADAFLAGGLAVLVVVLGLALRRQPPVAAGVVGVTLVVLRQLVDTAMAFESWQVLGLAGAALLIGGTIILLIRDSLRQWWDSGRQLWESLG